MKNERFSGILLHPTSLPGDHSIGDLGPEAFAFLDFLAEAGQSLWQVLPLSPTGLGNSPYNAQSSAAGNPLLISPRGLVRMGLLGESDVPAPAAIEATVDFGAALMLKQTLLRRAYQEFQHDPSDDYRQRLDGFRQSQSAWLDDYALFQALRSHFGDCAWQEWDPRIARHEPDALAEARRNLADEIAYQRFVQFVFNEQWTAVRRYANERGIRIIGDIPIYVALDSADVWANQDQFKLDDSGHPTVVAGVPPDLFSDTGQLWGNPCYRWDVMAERGFSWWLERFRRTLELCDVIRVDHFRGFAAGWQVPAVEKTAIRGEWVPGPGRAMFDRVEQQLGALPILVEDLGIITEDVETLRDELSLPGMKVLHFAFGGDADNPYLPFNYTRNCVVYTGTHDNDTTVGWYQSLGEDERRRVDSYLGPRGPEISWSLIQLALASVGQYVVIPMQDVLGLGHEARMNLPGTADGNWGWRMMPGALTDEIRDRLENLTRIYGRVAAEAADD